MLFGYKLRYGRDRLVLFETLYRVKPRFSIEPSGVGHGEKFLVNARPFERATALINRAVHLLPCTPHDEVRYQVSELVLLSPDKQSEGRKFQARMCLGSFKVISVEYLHYVLGNAPGKKSRKHVHLRRLRQYKGRDEQHPMAKIVAIMTFV